MHASPEAASQPSLWQAPAFIFTPGGVCALCCLQAVVKESQRRRPDVKLQCSAALSRKNAVMVTQHARD